MDQGECSLPRPTVVAPNSRSNILYNRHLVFRSRRPYKQFWLTNWRRQKNVNGQSMSFATFLPGLDFFNDQRGLTHMTRKIQSH